MGGERAAAPELFPVMPVDHPRVGGEKQCMTTETTQHNGSPPRGRGKASFAILRRSRLRITPAWAGKSCCSSLVYGIRWDHPRVGGEKITTGMSLLGNGGSPPRGRGKAKERFLVLCHDRITPAWAGKRKRASEYTRPLWDHPRVGGEKYNSAEALANRQGSPPRGRGKDERRRPGEIRARITPAWAGKSLRSGL